jgi:hypothetical protein
MGRFCGKTPLKCLVQARLLQVLPAGADSGASSRSQGVATHRSVNRLFPVCDGKEPIEDQRQHGPQGNSRDVHPRDRQTLHA